MKERGFALVTVVLLMLGLAVLATALGFAAAQQVAVRATLHDLARARAGAEAGARAAVDEWSAGRRWVDPIGERELLRAVDLEPGVRVAVWATRVARSSWLIEAEGLVARGAQQPVSRRVQRLVRGLDADSVAASFDAAVSAGRVRVDDGAHVGPAPAAPGGEATCAEGPGGGSAIRAPLDSTTLSSGSIVAGDPAVLHDADPSRFREGLGILDRAALLAAAVPVSAERVTPGAAQLGDACDPAARDNWGGGAGACATHYVLVHAPASLIIDGGHGQGLLLVSGDLVLERGFSFRGLILATGRITVRDADVHGAIAGAVVDIRSGGSVLLDRCAIAAALRETPALGRAIVPPRSWLPTFD